MIEIPRDTVDHNTTDELTILYDEVLTTTDKLDSTLIRKTTEKRAEAVKKSLKLPPLISNATIKDVLMLMIEKCVKKRGQQFEIVINAEVLDKVFTQRKERHSTLSKVLSRKFGIHNFGDIQQLIRKKNEKDKNHILGVIASTISISVLELRNQYKKKYQQVYTQLPSTANDIKDLVEKSFI